MDYEFWHDSSGNSPIIEEIGNDPQLKARVIKKLESHKPRSFEELRNAGEIEKIKIRNRNKVHEFRMDIGRKKCRFLFVSKNKIMYLLRFILKKRDEIMNRDIEIADNRADTI